MSEQPPRTQPEYDVFVSYSPSDRAWVEGYLLDALDAAHVHVLSELNFALGAPRISEFERAVRSSKRTLLVLSPAYMSEAALQFVDIMVQHFGLESGTWPVIPLLLKPVELPPRLAFLVALDATDPQNWTDAVTRLCSTLHAALPVPATRPQCPYPGMRAFREQDATHFYGREAEIEELLQRLRRHPFVAVIGPSGSGKSSLVSAGLIPALRSSTLFGPGTWLVRTMRPGAQPMAELALALGTTDVQQFMPAALMATEQHATHLLLVVDQLEEAFTQGSTQEEVFFDAIQRLSALRDCYVVVTVRADFFSDLLASTLWASIQAHRLEITPLGAGGLHDAIVKPAEKVGVFVESALVERLVASSAGQPGLLPFVQEVMVRLWEKLERRYLPLRAYEALVLPLAGYSGSERTGIQAAMAQLADEMICSLPPEQQRIVQRILLRLVQFGEGRDPTRRRQPVSALVAVGDDPLLFDRTLNFLVANRLLVLSGEEGKEPSVDLAHEAMLTGWPLLRQWIMDYEVSESTRRLLEIKAAEWVRLGQAEGGLLDPIELQEAEAWLQNADNITTGCSATLSALLAQSRVRRKRQRRRRNVTRMITFSALGLVAIVLFSIGANALVNWSLNRHWQAVPDLPSGQKISTLAGSPYGVVVGSFDYGVAWTTADGTWTAWQGTGLPLGNPVPGRNDPQANVQAIDSLALNPARPDERYVFINDRGIYRFSQRDATWQQVSQGLPGRSDICSEIDDCQPLAVLNDVMVYVADEAGFYLSQDGGHTWVSFRPDIAASPGTLYAAAFDAQGRLVLGDQDGLIRGSGAPPYAWTRVYVGGKVTRITPNTHGDLFLTVEGEKALRILCLDGHDMPMDSGQPLPIANRFLVWTGVVPVNVTSVAADLRLSHRFYFATTHAAVYVTDCERSAVRIGQRSWFGQGAGNLATAMDSNRREVLYWAAGDSFQRYIVP